jgi:hypothetical protein
MKKVLYSTTALVAAGMLAFSGGDANAAAHAKKKAKKKASKLVIKVGGFFTSTLGFAQQDSKYQSTANSTSRVGYDAFDIKNNSEIYFRGSTKLDNGITVSVIIQMEGDQEQANTGGSDNAVDETYVKLTGAFGDIRIGSTKAAGFVLKHRAPVVGAVNHDGPDANQWIHPPSAQSNNINVGTHMGAGDNMKIVYITNKFAGGFRIGASYEPSNARSYFMPAVGGNAGTNTQRYDGMISYEAKLGAVSVKADLGYDEQHGTAAGSNHAIRGGILLGFGGITVGGSYRTVDPLKSGRAGTSSSSEQDVFDIGISYVTGPFKISLTGLSAEKPLSNSVQGDDEVTHIGLGLQYNMGPGVDVLGTVFHREHENELAGDAFNNDGWAIVGGIKVSF